MTGADFLAALEHSLQISDECNHSYELQQAYVAAGHTEQEAQYKFMWRDYSAIFLSFGGINVTIDWTQPEGKRIVSATLAKDGSTLDPPRPIPSPPTTTSLPTRPTSPPSHTPPSAPSGARVRRR